VVDDAHFLHYPNGSLFSVRIPYANWASARISAEIANILLSEVLNYSTVLLDTKTIFSAHVVNYVAGCFDPDDSNCVERDTNNPQVHFTIETWRGGAIRFAQLSGDVQPTLISVLDFTLNDQVPHPYLVHIPQTYTLQSNPTIRNCKFSSTDSSRCQQEQF
jgi:hypothetical protein